MTKYSKLIYNDLLEFKMNVKFPTLILLTYFLQFAFRNNSNNNFISLFQIYQALLYSITQNTMGGCMYVK
jgi:hypothetical protein